MQSNDHTQQFSKLLQAIGKATPIYLTRTPGGTRLLQLPHSQNITATIGASLQRNIALAETLPDGLG